MRLLIRLAAALLILGHSGQASAFSTGGGGRTAIPQMVANPSGARMAIDLPAVQPLGQRAPRVTDDVSKGFKIGDLWCVPTLSRCWTAALSVAAGGASWQAPLQTTSPPLDVAANQGLQAEGWWGTQLATRNANVVALNKAIDLWRDTDGTTLTIGWLPNGDIDAVTADAFCSPDTNVSCNVSKIYDQSYNISSGALLSRDATVTPGLLISAATVATGGSGCTPGSATFTVVGGSGTAATFTGTVTGGGVLSGALTSVNVGSYYVYPPLATPTVSGGGCSVAPTITPTQDQRAPTWQSNGSVNGHRGVNFNNRYYYGTNRGGFLGSIAQYLDIPAGTNSDYRNTTVLFSGATQSAQGEAQAILGIGPTGGGFWFGTGASDGFVPSVAIRDVTNTTPFPALTSPAVWTFKTTSGTQTASVGNYTASWSQSLPATSVNGGTIGSHGGSRSGNMTMLGAGLFNSTFSAANIAKVTQAMNQHSSMVPQSNNLVVIVGDSIGYGNQSSSGSPWATMMTRNRYLDGNPAILNISVGGGAYTGHSYDYTANFTANFSAIVNSLTAGQTIYVVVAIGTNDLAGFASVDAAGLWTKATVYATLLRDLGSSVKLIVCTILPRTDASVPDIAVYNTLLRTNATKPVDAGGLGAIAIIDFAADPIWSSASFNDYLVAGIHPNDFGYMDMARTASTILNGLLK